jgi:predicted AAA+ superfamily ATPase
MEIEVFDRPDYTEKIRTYIGQPIIKILTGQRRIGKSFIIRQIIEIISKEKSNTHIIYINKELKEFSEILTDDDLYKTIKDQLKVDKNNYVFIDEIQEVPFFQNTLRSLLAENCCDIYCTGSNANMLSGELATYLAGRYMEFPIHSLSYREFMVFHRLENNNQTLQKYLRIGGMPYLVHFKGDEQLCFEYLKNLYSTILLKDVISRKQIRNIDFMQRLVAYIANNLGSLFSASNISKYLKSQQQKLPTQMVIDYTAALCDAYFIHKARRADIQGLKLFEVGEKYYFEDLGIRNAIQGFDPLTEIQKWMENVVYMHLIRLGQSVYVGKADNLEIDFIGRKLQERVYVQVAFRLELEKTKNREMLSLLKVKDNFPKFIVTLDDFALGTTTDGIQIIHLREFLMKEF